MAIEPTKAIVPPRGVKTDYPVRLEMPLQLLGDVLIRVLSVKQLIDSDPYDTQFQFSIRPFSPAGFQCYDTNGLLTLGQTY
jgi:hypothetical protein